MCVCACVCVCERERGGGMQKGQPTDFCYVVCDSVFFHGLQRLSQKFVVPFVTVFVLAHQIVDVPTIDN
jgi:hypothetical protein